MDRQARRYSNWKSLREEIEKEGKEIGNKRRGNWEQNWIASKSSLIRGEKNGSN